MTEEPKIETGQNVEAVREAWKSMPPGRYGPVMGSAIEVPEPANPPLGVKGHNKLKRAMFDVLDNPLNVCGFPDSRQIFVGVEHQSGIYLTVAQSQELAEHLHAVAAATVAEQADGGDRG